MNRIERQLTAITALAAIITLVAMGCFHFIEPAQAGPVTRPASITVPSCTSVDVLTGTSGQLQCKRGLDSSTDVNSLIVPSGRQLKLDATGIKFSDNTTMTTAPAAGGAWHTVGAGGEPAYAGTWVGFGGATQANLAFRVVDDVLQIRGWAKDGAVPTNSTPSVVFTLPVGARPLHETTFVVVATGISHPAQACVAHALSTGVVELIDCNTTAWVDFGGVIPLTL